MVLPSLVFIIPNSIRTIAVTGTAVMERSNPMNNDSIIFNPAN